MFCLFVCVCVFVCLFVFLYLIQIYISEPIWTKLCTHFPLGLEETVGYVWTRNFLPSRTFWPSLSRASADSRTEDGIRLKSHPTEDGCRRKSSATALYPWMDAGARVIREIVISVILAGVSAKSRKLRCSRRHLRVLTACVLYLGHCIKNAEKWTESMCAKMKTWWDRKQVN